ncbi:MAG TPA: glutamate--tRNA ligase [Thermomicrobiales bacterium]
MTGETTKPIRTRFAPSPTGDLHVGSAHTTLFNWLFTRHHGGTVVLRIEDTDRKRLIERSLGSITDGLTWLGLDWDEGIAIDAHANPIPDKERGDYGPYMQSERRDLYQQSADWLVEHGHAYYCFCSTERLAQVRQERQAKNILPTGYDRHCRDLPGEEVQQKLAAGEKPVVRLKVPLEGVVSFTDLVRGEITVDTRTLEDAVLIKSDGFPTYHLANVVDDHLMAITHILRAEEWIPTAPLHVLLYRAFDWEMPQIAHMVLLLGTDRKKLSKRHGSTSVQEFRANGIIPEALLNYLAIIGWSWDDKTEIFSKEELIEKFDLDRVKASSAIFDHQKLEWMNGQYINHILTLDEVVTRALPYLREAGVITEDTPAGYVKQVVALEKERIKRLSEVPEMTSYFFTPTVEYSMEALVSKKQKLTREIVLNVLEVAHKALTEGDVSDQAGTEARLRALGEELSLKAGQVFMPIRVALSGRTATPGLFEMMHVLGQEATLARLAAARDWLQQQGDDSAS